MRAVRLMFALLCVTTIVSGATASQLINPASGYVLAPSAAVLPTDTYQASAAFVRTEGTSELPNLPWEEMLCHGNGYNLRLVGGITKKCEAGIAFMSINKAQGTARAYSLSGKVKLFDSPTSKLAVSLGATYQNWSSDMVRLLPPGDPNAGSARIEFPGVLSPFIAIDKGWGSVCSGVDWALTTTLGLVWDNYSSADEAVADKDFFRPFFGFRAVGPRVTLLGDYKPRERSGSFNYADDRWSLAARTCIAQNLTATAGLSNYNIPYTSADTGFFVDFAYTFSK